MLPILRGSLRFLVYFLILAQQVKGRLPIASAVLKLGLKLRTLAVLPLAGLADARQCGHGPVYRSDPTPQIVHRGLLMAFAE
jgi:hypothetical protein